MQLLGGLPAAVWFCDTQGALRDWVCVCVCWVGCLVPFSSLTSMTCCLQPQIGWLLYLVYCLLLLYIIAAAVVDAVSSTHRHQCPPRAAVGWWLQLDPQQSPQLLPRQAGQHHRTRAAGEIRGREEGEKERERERGMHTTCTRAGRVLLEEGVL